MIGKFEYQAGKVLAYNDFGVPGGFPVVVQHGSIASIKDTALLEELGRRARVICIARPGYGESSPFILNSFLEYGKLAAKLTRELGIGEFDILSSSAGAPYGYALARACAGKARNIYVYSGTPALYDEVIQKNWPYPVVKEMTIEESQKTAYEVFFAHIPESDKARNDVKDSMANNCFGEGQNLRIRFKDWGFTLPEISSKVYMQHSRKDGVIPYQLAVRTAELLRNCELELLEEGSHFSAEGYKAFVGSVVFSS